MLNSSTSILAIESSCDETAAAVGRRLDNHISILSSDVASQINIHALTGGVVPEAAAREHTAVIQPLIEKVMGESGLSGQDLDAIAVTVGPGLVPALSVGVTAAQTLAYAWGKPIVPVHHLEGHIYSALLAPASPAQTSNFKLQISKDPSLFPVLALIVSGGHTMLVFMKGHLNYQVLGQTRDDAAGEAFDKVARMLGLPYPGGPAISKLAETGDNQRFPFSRPMSKSNDLDFSFSGLKTEVLYTLREKYPSRPDTKSFAIPLQDRADLAASFQIAVVEALGLKVRQAITQTNPARLLLAGGVAANTILRHHLADIARETGLPLQSAPPSLCGDNAVMIALAAHVAFPAGRSSPWQNIDAKARLNLSAF